MTARSWRVLSAMRKTAVALALLIAATNLLAAPSASEPAKMTIEVQALGDAYDRSAAKKA